VPSLTNFTVSYWVDKVLVAAPSMVAPVAVIVTALAELSIFLITYSLPTWDVEPDGIVIAIAFDVQSQRFVVSVVLNESVAAVIVCKALKVAFVKALA